MDCGFLSSRSTFTHDSQADASLLLESKIQSDTAYQVFTDTICFRTENEWQGFESHLKTHSVVQKQQETLIVWSEGDNFDLALSFQEKVWSLNNLSWCSLNMFSNCTMCSCVTPLHMLSMQAGCDEIWEKICSVQGKDPSVDFTQVLQASYS